MGWRHQPTSDVPEIGIHPRGCKSELNCRAYICSDLAGCKAAGGGVLPLYRVYAVIYGKRGPMGRILIVIFLHAISGGLVLAAQQQQGRAKSELVAPSIDAVNHLVLARNGAEGSMQIVKSTTGVEIRTLFLPGSRSDKPTQACNVEVKPLPITLIPAGAPEGMARYQADMAACSFSLDVLDGAVIVLGKPCDIVQSKCHIDASGLWGPPALRITAQKIVMGEDQRVRAEAAAQTALRRLLDVKPDPERLKEVIRRHVAFKVERDQQCRDYDGESRTGFCAARLSEAHAFALGAEYQRSLKAFQAEEEHKKERKARKKHAQKKGKHH
jgi:hypothetical protein